MKAQFYSFYLFVICLLSSSFFLCHAPLDNDQIIDLIMHDIFLKYPALLETCVLRRTDPHAVKKLLVGYAKKYGRKYAGSFLRTVAHDIGLKTEEEINVFIRDCKELMKAVLPDKLLYWILSRTKNA